LCAKKRAKSAHSYAARAEQIFQGGRGWCCGGGGRMCLQRCSFRGTQGAWMHMLSHRGTLRQRERERETEQGARGRVVRASTASGPGLYPTTLYSLVYYIRVAHGEHAGLLDAGPRLEAATIAVLVDFCYPTSPVDFCYPTANFPTSSTTSIFFVGSYFSTSSTKSIFFGGRAGSAPDTGESHVQNKYLHDVVNNNAAETRRALSKDGSEWCMCHHPGPRAFWLGGGCQGGRLSEGRRAWVRR